MSLGIGLDILYLEADEIPTVGIKVAQPNSM